jgi:hypothetical protein
MDLVLEGLNPVGRLPFKDAPSPQVYTSIFWGLWGGSGGEIVQEPEEQGIVEYNLVSAETSQRKGGAEARHLTRRVGRRQVGRIS